MKRYLKFLLTRFFALLALVILPAVACADDVSQKSARPSPDWLRDGVIYEIFPRDFSAAGDINGITAQLDRLKDLGVTILWTMPIHPIGEKFRKGAFGSPYSIKDYYAVDPNYGTLADYQHFVSEAHHRGLKVIMDIVANHTAWDSVMMTNTSFYKQDGTGHVIPPVPEWTDVAGLNYASPELRTYMIAMLKYWIQTCDVDGFRCDVAYMVPTDYWEQVRAELTKIKPDIMMLAEASKPELLLNAFDVDYSWPLLGTLNDVMQRGAPASNIRASWEESARQFPQNSLHMRITDDHDEARAISRFGIRGALAASVLMFSLDGVPLIFNGMEVGDATESGDPALFDKLPIFWHPKERPPLTDIYRGLIQLRKQYAPFRSNRVIWLKNSDEANLVTFERQDETDQFVVVINLSNRPLIGRVEVTNAEEFNQVPISGMPKPPGDDFPLSHLGAYEWRIYHRTISH
jgi:glycosidase